MYEARTRFILCARFRRSAAPQSLHIGPALFLPEPNLFLPDDQQIAILWTEAAPETPPATLCNMRRTEGFISYLTFLRFLMDRVRTLHCRNKRTNAYNPL